MTHHPRRLLLAAAVALAAGLGIAPVAAGTAPAATPVHATPATYLLSVDVTAPAPWVSLLLDSRQVALAKVRPGDPTTVTTTVRVISTRSALTAVAKERANDRATQPARLSQLRLTRVAPQFTTVGNRVIAPSGRAVTLHGVNRNGYELTPTSYREDDGDFAAMAAWGSDVVRLQLSEVFWNRTSCGYDPAYARRVGAAVRSITARGMLALLDLHTNDPFNRTCRGARPQQQLMADMGSIDFWRSVATMFRANPRVAFDLYNEPHDIPATVWRDGGVVADGASTWRVAGMQQLYDAVRSTGARNLVFVSGPGWSYRIDAALYRPIAGYGIVYAAHEYNGSTCGGVHADANQTWLQVAHDYPVVISEFGTNCPISRYNANVIDYADQHGLGWIAFAWNADPDPSSYSLLRSWQTHAPSLNGLPVRDALWRYRGWHSYGGR